MGSTGVISERKFTDRVYKHPWEKYATGIRFCKKTRLRDLEGFIRGRHNEGI